MLRTKFQRGVVNTAIGVLVLFSVIMLLIRHSPDHYSKFNHGKSQEWWYHESYWRIWFTCFTWFAIGLGVVAVTLGVIFLLLKWYDSGSDLSKKEQAKMDVRSALR